MPGNQGHKAHTRLAHAMSMLQSGQWSQAETICQQLLKENTAITDANYLLGVIYQNTQRLERAIRCYETVIREISGHPDALNNLGSIFESLKNHPDAFNCYRQAASHNPGHLLANYNLGRMLRISGQPGKAVTHLSAALALSPDSVHVLLELALAFKAQGKLDEAINHLQHARNCAPSDPAVYNVIGNVFQSQGEIEQAVRSYSEAIRLKPDYASAFNNLGSALVARGNIPAALENYRTAARLRPDWPGAASNVLLAANYISDNTENLFCEHKQYGNSLENRVGKREATSSRKPGQKIRVGYISPDFRFHSVAYFLKALFLHHDQTRFDVVCFSDVASPDGMTRELESLVPDWHSIIGLSDTEVFQQIQSCKIDILVDLAGHTANNRLSVFAMQAAPVQVSYLGYPNTTGLATIQYRVTDPWADPPGKADFQHTEKLVRLPECFLCYTPPTECPEVKGLPADSNGFVTYGSFNVLAKISDACIETWSTILRQSPHSRLILKSSGLQDQVTRDYIYSRFTNHGISPDRVDLVARTANFHSHMAMYNQLDISLDTFPYNGTTTICESLWMGVPVISAAGTHHAGRVGASLLHQVKLDEFVANNVSEYASKAWLLAENRDKLRGLRSSLRTTTASSPLCNGAALASAIEEEYKKMLL